MRRIPLIPTLIVLAAVAVMIRLGLWQLDRKAEKEALLARYAAAGKAPEQVFEGASAGHGTNVAALAYHRVWLDCVKVDGLSARAGHNTAGDTGWAQVADCALQGGDHVSVVIGWAAAPAPVQWQGGLVHGMFDANRVVVAEPPLAGLQANARPDPSAIANNHLSYALQWFAFAASALAIYALALRKRLAAGGEGG